MAWWESNLLSFFSSLIYPSKNAPSVAKQLLALPWDCTSCLRVFRSGQKPLISNRCSADVWIWCPCRRWRMLSETQRRKEEPSSTTSLGLKRLCVAISIQRSSKGDRSWNRLLAFETHKQACGRCDTGPEGILGSEFPAAWRCRCWSLQFYYGLSCAVLL